MKQKFHKGDLVQVAKDLGPSMSHFTGDCRAIVIGSYRDKYGGGKDETQLYTLFLEGRDTCSWYHEHQLTLIKRGQYDLLDTWEEEAKKRYKKWCKKNGVEFNEDEYDTE